jgi:hypothetical protein
VSHLPTTSDEGVFMAPANDDTAEPWTISHPTARHALGGYAGAMQESVTGAA